MTPETKLREAARKAAAKWYPEESEDSWERRALTALIADTLTSQTSALRGENDKLHAHIKIADAFVQAAQKENERLREALQALIIQIERGHLTDDHGHDFNLNRAYQEARTALGKEKS